MKRGPIELISSKILNKKIIFIIIGILLFTCVLYFYKYSADRAIFIEPDFSEKQTIKEINDNISINFTTCSQDKKSKRFEFGSVTIAVLGKTGNLCHIRYGGEIENPNWDGALPVVCKVPQSLGVVEFNKNNFGLDFHAIEKYCSN